MEDLEEDAQIVLAKVNSFLTYLETTNMTKCFKMVLLDALLEKGGLVAPLSIADLAMASWEIFEKHVEWKSDIRDDLQNRSAWQDERVWVLYWRDNPVKAYVGGKFFRIDKEQFVLNFELVEDGLDILEGMIRELIELRQTQYWKRHQNKEKPEVEEPKKVLLVENAESKDRFVSHLPFYPIEIAAGCIQDLGALPEPVVWFRVAELTRKRLTVNLFVAQITGDSMEPRIPNHSYCLFSTQIGGSKNGEIILVHLSSSISPDAMGSHLIKKYRSEKTYDEDGSFTHSKIILESLNPQYSPIVIKDEQLEDFRPLARFVGVLMTPDE